MAPSFGDRTRVAITGLGVRTPVGNDVDGFWTGVLAGKSSAAPIRAFDPHALEVRFACEVPDFDVSEYLAPKVARRLDRTTLFGVSAGLEAVRSAARGHGTGATGDLGADPARCAVIAGTGIGGLSTLVEQQAVCTERGPARVSPFFVPAMMPNATAAHLAMTLGWTGPALCVATACAAGANAIGEAARLVRTGAADVVLAGGTEAALTPLTVAAFWRMGALSTRNDDPARASRPFDADRDGFVMGEGAGFVVLEGWDHAVSRGAVIHAELSGYGANADAYHITAPMPDGAGAAACMQAALDDAGVAPDGVGHVNAHGTSTPLNDVAEAEAIRKVFGAGAPPVTSIKGTTGHLVGAAGAVELVATVLAVREGTVPPTANHERTDDQVALDVVAGEPRAIGPAAAISNSFGFGGHNATLVVRPA